MRQDVYPEYDKILLNNAIKMSNRRVKGTMYKYITIKEALTFIGYPEQSKIDVKA